MKAFRKRFSAVLPLMCGIILLAPIGAGVAFADSPTITIVKALPPTCTTEEIDGTVNGTIIPPLDFSYHADAESSASPSPATVTMDGNNFIVQISGLTPDGAKYDYDISDSTPGAPVILSSSFNAASPTGDCDPSKAPPSATASAVPQDTYADITVTVAGAYTGTSLTIKYGTSATALTSSATAVSNGTTFYGDLTSLTPKMTYYYQAFSSINDSALMAAPQSFTTTTGAAGGSYASGTVTSLSVIGETQTTATVVGSVAKSVTSGVQIMIDKAGNGIFGNPTTPTIQSDKTFTYKLSDLKAGQTYHIVAVKSSDTTTRLSNVVGFMTIGVSLTSYVSSLMDTTATISAQATGADSPTVHYGTNAASMTSTKTMDPDLSTPGHYTANIGSLSANTAYYYQITSGDGKTLYMYPAGFKTLASGSSTSTTVPTIVGTGTGASGVSYNGSALVTCGLNGPLSNGTDKNPDGSVIPKGQQACGFPQFLELINRIISFLLLLVAPIIATVLILYHGLMVLTSGGNTEKLTAAKGALTKVVVGFAIACGAWLLVQFVMQKLGVVSTVFPTFY